MKKVKELGTRLKIAKRKANKNYTNKSEKNITPLGAALKISTEMVAAVLVGTTIGFILDNTFDSKPWLILTFFFIGVAAGILNVIRSAKLMQKKN